MRVAASSCGRTDADIVSFRKLGEGGSNRTFELTMRDGLQVVAKLPYPSTIPKRYATASEVATMDLVRLHGVPVPKIYDYSTTSQNPVGCEFIIMERVAGKELRHVWSKETPQQRLKMVEQVVKMESLLFSIKLPASGSVYYKRDLPADVETVDIPGIGGLDGLCIGPEVKLRWWDKERAQLPVDRKPRKSCWSLLFDELSDMDRLRCSGCSESCRRERVGLDVTIRPA